MNTSEKILESARNTIISESKSVAKLADLLNSSFAEAVQLIFECKTRLIVTGIGKSAIIAQKIVRPIGYFVL